MLLSEIINQGSYNVILNENLSKLKNLQPARIITWIQTHELKEKEKKSLLLRVALKLALFVLIPLSVPIWLPGAAFYGLSKVWEKYKVTYNKDSLLSLIRGTTKNVEIAKLTTMKTNAKNVCEEIQKQVVSDIKNNTNFLEKIKNNAEQLNESNYPSLKVSVNNLLKSIENENENIEQVLRDVLNHPDYRNLKNNNKNHPIVALVRKFSFVGEIETKLKSKETKTLKEKSQEARAEARMKAGLDKLTNDTAEITPSEQDRQEFSASIGKLMDLLRRKDDEHPTGQNRKIIAALRKALKNPVYQTLKYDAHDPSVKLLHRLSVAIWNETHSMNAYQELGKGILKRLTNPNSSSADSCDGQSLAQKLKDSQAMLVRDYYSQGGLRRSIRYAFTHPRQIMGSLASEGGLARTIPGIFGMDVYDSHGTLSNNPSLQGKTNLEFKINEKSTKATINNCYGGSPTIGDYKISPEFEAVLQAAENNQLLPEDKRDEKIPHMVIYNNLQNLHKTHGEGPRSGTIMALNYYYPLSFRGTTLAKDTEFYLMKNENDNTAWNADAFGSKMEEKLLASFDPNPKDNGFYFHGSKEQWESVFKAIIAKANEHFQKYDNSMKDNFSVKSLKGAYQEYVYSMLIAYIEMDSAKKLADKKIENPLITAITACKENIDRGGMENIKYLYNKLPKPTENEKQNYNSLMVGVSEGRPLGARDRPLLSDRMPQVLSYMKTTTPDEYKDESKELLNRILDCTIENNTYQAYLNQPSVEDNPQFRQSDNLIEL